MLNAPYLVADQNRTVYAFDLESTGIRQYSIVCRRWTLSQGWSPSVDILLPEFLGVAPTFEGVFLDQHGIIHLVYFAGDEDSGDIYYSQAHAVEADQAHAWSKPIVVAQHAGPLPAASIIGNEAGDLVIIYGGQRDGIGVYSTSSTDGGSTWSTPSVVSIVDRPELWPISIRLEADAQGWIHVVWHLGNNIGQGDGIYYARLGADLATWENQTLLARRDTEQENMGWASIVSSGEELIVIYQDSFPATRWMRRSSDGGQTWSNPVRPFPHVGGYGYASLVEDSTGALHMILGNRYPQPEIHGMWHSQLVHDQWTPLQPIISGPKESSFDPTRPVAIISQGNVILATWVHDVNREFRTGAWYSYTLLDAPELPIVALPKPLQTVSSPTVVPATPTLKATSPPTIQATLSSQTIVQQESNPGLSIFWGVIPVIVFVFVVIVVRISRSRVN